MKISTMEARRTNVSEIVDSDEVEEEAGEEIESAPPLKIGEEREILSCPGLKKKLLKTGLGWETPELGDEVTVHSVGTLPDGSKCDSSRDREPFTFKLGQGEIVTGLDHGIVTMKRGECALFTIPPELGYGSTGVNGVPPDSVLQFEVELISWIRVVDVCKDGGIIKKILSKGERDEQPGDLDEVTVKYEVKLADGSVVAKTPEEGLEFYIKDGHFCLALPRVVKTMRRGEKVILIVQSQYALGEHGRDANDGFPSIPSNATLDIDLELVSFKPVIDVNGDLSVLKKILKEGEGIRSPNEGAVIHVRYTAMLEDGTIFEKKGFNGDGPFEFVVDEEQVTSGLDRAAATMKKGEVSILTVKPEYGFGNIKVERDLAIVPANSTLIYQVEMVDFIQEKEPFEMGSNHERIDAAGKKKEEGNRLFKSGKYKQAAKRYDKATDYVSEDRYYEDSEQKLVKSLRVSCWLNNAASSLKLNDFQGAIKLCSKIWTWLNWISRKPLRLIHRTGR
ncbi:peptidyl-prolyl cis-trans isomerase FKBP65-like isoform X3 [Magnolia sinica]|uniref:peptidyl-prolyl cis-trans isomerase FKBP65-like isoform X3 n=1 Tax=Magnolia sinica TaxID=86752 RepID=UPI00265A8577|nr:peptidyl-prolyl cis-trans isomerase FKBP65-like isoform X3 [Magnolia sinica]